MIKRDEPETLTSRTGQTLKRCLHHRSWQKSCDTCNAWYGALNSYWLSQDIAARDLAAQVAADAAAAAILAEQQAPERARIHKIALDGALAALRASGDLDHPFTIATIHEIADRLAAQTPVIPEQRPDLTVINGELPPVRALQPNASA